MHLDGGHLISYRASKATLNMFAKAYALDNPNICVQIQHPGWVQTDMGCAAGHIPPTKPAESIGAILRCVEAMGRNGKRSGNALVSYDGSTIPW